MNSQHARLLQEMVRYNTGRASLTQHLLKVYGFASAIGRLEGLDENTCFILETAAILHDIGIPVSMQKYGSSEGKYQEIEGPIEAEVMMKRIGGYEKEQIERVKYLIGHHHTYHNVDGIDYQILIEADFLVNLFEGNASKDTIQGILEHVFQTESGKDMLKAMFSIP